MYEKYASFSNQQLLFYNFVFLSFVWSPSDKAAYGKNGLNEMQY